MVPVPLAPTAKHVDVEGHDTPLSAAVDVCPDHVAAPCAAGAAMKLAASASSATRTRTSRSATLALVLIRLRKTVDRPRARRRVGRLAPRAASQQQPGAGEAGREESRPTRDEGERRALRG